MDGEGWDRERGMDGEGWDRERGMDGEEKERNLISLTFFHLSVFGNVVMQLLQICNANKIQVRVTYTSLCGIACVCTVCIVHTVCTCVCMYVCMCVCVHWILLVHWQVSTPRVIQRLINALSLQEPQSKFANDCSKKSKTISPAKKTFTSQVSSHY